MARVKGSIEFSSNYEAALSKPMDARMLVPSYSDLFDTNNWVTRKGAPSCYNGMIVAVANTSDTTKNGLYMLIDSVNSRKPDVTKLQNWIKIGESSDISDFQNRLATIESALSIFDDRLSALEADKVVITRDNEFNYKQKTPINNEICLVDVAGFGIRVKVGDGETPFTSLPYLDDAVLTTIDNLVVKGYLLNNVFYKDSEHTVELDALPGRIYIDVTSSRIYTHDGLNYQTSSVSSASSTVAGVAKLYNTLGTNTDGSMTQKAVTDELNQKIEVDFVAEEEMLIFDNDFDDNV